MNKQPQKEKRYFDIKLECTAPVTISYRILAETPEEALSLIDRHSPISIKPPQLHQKRKLKATIYEAGSLMIKLIRNFI
jgi:hypothetical protein